MAIEQWFGRGKKSTKLLSPNFSMRTKIRHFELVSLFPYTEKIVFSQNKVEIQILPKSTDFGSFHAIFDCSEKIRVD